MTTGLAALSYSVLTLLLKAELDMTALRRALQSASSRPQYLARALGRAGLQKPVLRRDAEAKDPQGKVVLRAILTLEMLL